jgi:hypothetical protein
LLARAGQLLGFPGTSAGGAGAAKRDGVLLLLGALALLALSVASSSLLRLVKRINTVGLGRR